MSKWICEIEPEVIINPIENERFQLLLAEISSILYDTFRKLYVAKPSQSKPLRSRMKKKRSLEIATDRKDFQ